MSRTLSDISWPVARLGEALEVLCRRSGLIRAEGTPEASTAAPGQDPDRWVAQAASAMGVEAEPVDASYGRVDQLVAGAGPALLRLKENGQDRFLVLLESKGQRLSVLTPDRTVVRVAPQPVCSALGRQAEGKVEHTVEQVLDQAGIRARRRRRTRQALLGELLVSARVSGGWMVRPSPADNLLTQAREFGLPRLLALLVGSHTVYFGLWLLSWWLLGWISFQGRLEPGWLLAWGLILLLLIPFRLLVTYLGGLLTVRGSALLKRRLLFGALKLEPDQVRRLGAGQLLGRVLETEVLDSMALCGGFLSLTALVELFMAAVVLGFGAGGTIHVLLLVAALVVTLLLGRRHLRQRRQWTDRRFTMTNDLVERMAGHRTRLAQEPREHWNEEEDRILEDYLGVSVRLDRTVQSLKVLVPRGWFLAGLLGLAPAFVFGDPSSAGLAVAIGGILVAYGALRNLADGIERLSAAAIAWDRIKLFWHAATKNKPGSRPGLVSVPTNVRPAQGTTLLEARNVVFKHSGRHNPVLEYVSLRIRAGQQLLLQGESGGGKSTLGAVLAALRDPESGLLLLEGLDRQTVGEAEWRRRVAMAPQFHENHVLMGTFAFNLLMGRCWPPKKEDLEEAEGVCRALGLGPLLDRMPAGMQQVVGETGWQLSHGERSRLFLARALLQGADLLILDESLAALDPETLQTSLAFVLEKAPTVLMIAHP